jgi:hypothetical protein
MDLGEKLLGPSIRRRFDTVPLPFYLIFYCKSLFYITSRVIQSVADSHLRTSSSFRGGSHSVVEIYAQDIEDTSDYLYNISRLLDILSTGDDMPNWSLTSLPACTYMTFFEEMVRCYELSGFENTQTLWINYQADSFIRDLIESSLLQEGYGRTSVLSYESQAALDAYINMVYERFSGMASSSAAIPVVFYDRDEAQSVLQYPTDAVALAFELVDLVEPISGEPEPIRGLLRRFGHLSNLEIEAIILYALSKRDDASKPAASLSLLLFGVDCSESMFSIASPYLAKLREFSSDEALESMRRANLPSSMISAFTSYLECNYRRPYIEADCHSSFRTPFNPLLGDKIIVRTPSMGGLEFYRPLSFVDGSIDMTGSTHYGRSKERLQNYILYLSSVTPKSEVRVDSTSPT